MALRSVSSTPVCLEAEALDVGREADGLHHLVGLELLGLAVLADRDETVTVAPVIVDRLDLGAGQDLDAELLVLLLDLLGDLGVLVGQRARRNSTMVTSTP